MAVVFMNQFLLEDSMINENWWVTPDGPRLAHYEEQGLSLRTIYDLALIFNVILFRVFKGAHKANCPKRQFGEFFKHNAYPVYLNKGINQKPLVLG